MVEFGRINTLVVQRLTDFGAYLDEPDGEPENEVLLPQRFVEDTLAVGDRLDVFLHRDSEDRPVATTQTPYAQAGEFACLEVKDVTRIGAFLDWGLDKDLLLPFGAQAYPVRQKGQRIVVYVHCDPVSERMVAATKFNKFLRDPPRGLRSGQRVELLPYQKTQLGLNVVVDQAWKGLLFCDEGDSEPEIGETVTGYVRQVRPDGRVDLSLRPSGGRAARDARDTVLEALDRADGHLELGDKSPPEAIRAQLDLSKKGFKRAIGALYREGRIRMTETSITRIQKD